MCAPARLSNDCSFAYSQVFAQVTGFRRRRHRPAGNVYAGTVLIEPDGTMQAYSAAPGDARQFTSLAGISFPLGS